MAKYTKGQEVWIQSKSEDNVVPDIFIMPGSPLNLKGEVLKVDGDKYTVKTSFGELVVTESKIDDGMKANGKIEEMREEAEKWAKIHAGDAQEWREKDD